MSNLLFKKIITLSGLIILLMVALSMTSGVISERNRYQAEASASIASSWTGSQQITGPFIVMPYLVKVESEIWDAQKLEKIIKSEMQRRVLYVLPNTLDITGNVPTELRYRGIYKVPVYSSKLKFSGEFEYNALEEHKKSIKNADSWEAPYLTVIINDIRGIAANPKLLWQEQQIAFKAASLVRGAPQGIHAPLALDEAQTYRFAFDLDLRGSENLSFTPIGLNTTVALTSDWQHPSFKGMYLPASSTVDEHGFSANWQLSSFSSNIDLPLQTCANGQCGELLNQKFGVSLMEGINIYHLSERSIKYGILFISLTFIAFLVYEITKKQAIHPVQYLLVGLALAIFYLLLISLSEHIAFAQAYMSAACACTGLLGYYLSAVLKSIKAGVLFTVMLGLLYAMLYVIINSEDSALLMGSGVLFLMLAILMGVTRHIDWYQLKNSEDWNIDTVS